MEKGIKKKKYAQEIGIDIDQLKSFLGEAIKNEEEAIKKCNESPIPKRRYTDRGMDQIDEVKNIPLEDADKVIL